MKTAKKTLAILLALMLVAALGVTAFAAGTGSITITPPANTPSNATNSYTIYKVFDADGNGSAISYKLVPGKTTAPTGFSVDAQGNVTYTGAGTGGQLTQADITAIANYVTNADIVGTATSTGTAAATLGNLPNGYYYISTSTGAAVTVTSTNPNAQVNDKNEVPPVTKKLTGDWAGYDAAGKAAIAQLGSVLDFEVEIGVKKGSMNYVFRDTMNGLSYVADSLSVTLGSTTVAAGSNTYTVNASGSSIAVTFNNDYIKTLENQNLKIAYKAQITRAALNDNPAKNTASLEYGRTPNIYKTPDVVVPVYTAQLTVTKRAQSATGAGLAGAGFVIKNSGNKYYKLDNNVVTWVDNINDAEEHTSSSTGAVAPFTGLAAGTYTLVEKTVPSGYNKAADESFTIVDSDISQANLQLTRTVVNTQGAVLPTTGGVGTTIFYVLGSCLLLGAAVLMITRKRMGREG